MIHEEDDGAVRSEARPAKSAKRAPGSSVPAGVQKLHVNSGYNVELVAERLHVSLVNVSSGNDSRSAKHRVP